MAIKNIEIQDSDGNIYYPHTNATVVKNGESTVAEQLKEIGNKVDNIDLSASKVNLTAINGMSAKNVQAGIQELFTFASNGKSAIAGKVGNITGNNTHAEIANRIQTDKNTAAANLNGKGVSASGNEALASLVSKIANISVSGMGGVRVVSGTTTTSLDKKSFSQISGDLNSLGGTNISTNYLTFNLAFRPRFIIAFRPGPTESDYSWISFMHKNFVFAGIAKYTTKNNTGYLMQPIITENTVYYPLYGATENLIFNYIAFE
ncbi:TPA: hypothetical protein LA462_000479 [Clostridium botulinum]|nr:hypothetical protein [Clostridium botulinum]